MVSNNTIQIERYLFEHITNDRKKLFSGEIGIRKVKSVLQELDNPQNEIKTIHIAGTSGKSSTAFLISQILGACGFKVGLHISPHLLDIRERFQINNKLVSKQKFLKYFNEILPIIMSRDDDIRQRLSYFEILTVFAFYIFWKEKVDYAVIEVGIGGLYDATNTIDSNDKLVVLTKIGLDHTEVLGKTVREIAYQKAMIIRDKNVVVSLWQEKAARKVVENIVKKRKAKLFYLKEHENFLNIRLALIGTKFDWKFQKFALSNIQISMLGRYQAENCALALTVVASLSLRDNFILQDRNIRRILSKVFFPGRLEIVKIKDKIIILDGAHNPQKMSSFLDSINEIFPDRKFNFIVGFKKNKDIQLMLRQIVPFANSVTATSFFLDNPRVSNFSIEAKKIGLFLEKIGFLNYLVVPNAKEALEAIIKKQEDIIITGSLYLIAELYSAIERTGDSLS